MCTLAFQDGEIHSLGLLEAPVSNTAPLPPPPAAISPCNHRLWTSKPYLGVPYRFCGTSTPPDTYRVLPLTSTPSRVSLIPDHIIPHEGLLWAEHTKQLFQLERITCYVGPEATTADRRLHGLQAECPRNSEDRMVGMRRNLSTYGEFEKWPAEQVVSLEVDGPGGEFIDEVSVSERSEEAIAIKASFSRAF